MHFTASRSDIVRSVRHRWLLSYWERLRNGQPVPPWRSLNVDEFSRMVDNMQFCDVIDDAGRMRFIVRFCGARLVQAYGECDNEYFDEKLPPLLRDQILAIYCHTVDTTKPVYTISQVPDRDGKPVDVERLLLPFARNGSGVGHVLAMLEWVSVEGGFEGRKLLRSQTQAPVYSVCATIDGIAANAIAP